MAAEILVKISNLAKVYGHKIVFTNLDLEISRGMFALLAGANGAGKSTILKIIAGLAEPTKGSVEKKADLRMAYIGHATFLYPGLTAVENLLFWGKAQQIDISLPVVLEMLEKLGLLAHAYDHVGIFSRGMAQRLNFCRALMLKPDFFLLDEPFTGLDQETRQLLRSELSHRQENGAAILMVSHAITEDAPSASHLFVLKNGNIILANMPDVHHAEAC